MPEHSTKVAFKDKREHIAEVNIPNMAYPNQHIVIKIPHGSRDRVIVPGTVHITFKFDTESTGKTCSFLKIYVEHY